MALRDPAGRSVSQAEGRPTAPGAVAPPAAPVPPFPTDALRISCSCRDAAKAAALADSGLVDDAHVFDLDDWYTGLDARGLEALASATHVVVTMPPVADLDRDPLLALHSETLTSSRSLQWVGYLSTTGVYGDHGGAWVDETTLPNPSPRTAPRLRAEEEWVASGLPVHVFRLAGIYGRGRSALETVLKGAAGRAAVDMAVETAGGAAAEGEVGEAAAVATAATATTAAVPAGEGEGATRKAAGQPADEHADDAGAVKWVSRIHVADICGVLMASMVLPPSRQPRGTVYNVADVAPAPRAEVCGRWGEGGGKGGGRGLRDSRSDSPLDSTPRDYSKPITLRPATHYIPFPGLSASAKCNAYDGPMPPTAPPPPAS